jgi:group I intron endonuclease
MIIYRTTNLITGKIYVGKDCHNNPSYLGSGIVIRAAISKYGRNNFRKETLEVCDLSNINDRERHWIKKLDSRNPNIGYNIAPGGDGAGFGPDNILYGKHHSDETRKKMSEAWRGRVISDETRHKMSMAHVGLLHTEEERKKLSEAAKNRSPEIRKKRSAAQTGPRNHQYGTRRSPEHMKKMADARKAKRETRLELQNVNA